MEVLAGSIFVEGARQFKLGLHASCMKGAKTDCSWSGEEQVMSKCNLETCLRVQTTWTDDRHVNTAEKVEPHC